VPRTLDEQRSRQCHTVGEAGKACFAVTTELEGNENRQDFADFARKNLERFGMEDLVEFRIRDMTEGMEEKEIDAVVVDIPNPHEVVAHAKGALRPGGYFAGYVPTMNQVERLVAELKEHDLAEIRTTETLLREIVAGKGAVRPSFEMLGHTGYITVARKLL